MEENRNLKNGIKQALDILERWGGYQDRIITATEILKELLTKNTTEIDKVNEALFYMIIERPDSSLDWNKPIWPFCNSEDLEDRGGEHTCIGWFPRVPEDDTTYCPGNPNLSSNHYSCNGCGKAVTYFVKYGNIWVEEGVPQHEF